MKLESAAFITGATFQYFNMSDITDKAETFVPPNVLSGDKGEQRLWLHQQVKRILQKFVMNEQESYYKILQQTIHEINTETTQEKQLYVCSGCGKQYKYEKAKINHEKKVHSIEINGNFHGPIGCQHSQVVDFKVHVLYIYFRLVCFEVF